MDKSYELTIRKNVKDGCKYTSLILRIIWGEKLQNKYKIT